MNHICIIIVAGGSGTRMGSEIPKQFLMLSGRPLLMHTIDRFSAALPGIRTVVALPLSQLEYWEQLCRQHLFESVHSVVAGGPTRFDSVKNALSLLPDCDYIGVHDGVRPLVSASLITRTLEAAQDFGAAIPALPVADSLREVTRCESCADPSKIIDSRPVDRNRFLAVQTPQFFRSQILRKGYRQDYIPEFTDDASVVESAGYTVTLVPGDPVNIKVATPTDLRLAAALISSGRNDNAPK
ncbi:MAG: 2-C-methyl-D-erythritol 4-phosphate cytidylyltransferase [Rikenellaceae bacterium]|nr:2-C-methyl-D-erythritol 4-phosphate cytidylyltransferase [Rikenellaceae bacterium]